MIRNTILQLNIAVLNTFTFWVFVGLQISFTCINSFAQETIPEGYFQFPFNPGKTNFLSGNMGELRTNHFHGGLDVKTAAQVGLPILAAADGYVSKVRVSSYGYGNVLYITHPNNYVTVYAHLDKFNKEIGDLVKVKQYENKTFELDVFPEINQITVTKGMQIGVSGNTGSSGGPHLHFEIRDKNDKLYNPLMFGFPEIKDNIAPFFDKVVLKTFDQKARVNNEFGRFEYSPIKKGKSYTIPSPITAKGTIGIELKVYDKMAFTHNAYGVTCIEVKVDGKETFYHNLKTLPFEDNKYINAHIDYENFIRKGRRFERCYISDGNKLSTYKRAGTNGKLNIKDTSLHQVEINIYDAHNNMSTLNFQIKGAGSKEVPFTTPLAASTKVSTGISTELYENILKIQGKYNIGLPVQIFKKGEGHVIAPEYIKNGQAIYLYDMRKGLPDSVQISGEVKQLGFSDIVPSGKEYLYKNNRIRIKFSKDCLFDTLYLQYKNGLTPTKAEVFQINDMSVPLFKNPQISFLPIEPTTDKERTYIYNVTRWPQFEGGVWKQDSIAFNPKALGRFSCMFDGVPPVIKFINKVGNSVRFNIFDRNSGINSFTATLNGNWVLMNYDHKRKLIWSSLSSSEEKMKGEFVLQVVDNSGNKTTFKRKFL